MPMTEHSLLTLYMMLNNSLIDSGPLQYVWVYSKCEEDRGHLSASH